MDLFDLFVKIKGDSSDYNSALDKAHSDAESFSSKIGNVIGVAGKLAAAGVTAAATGLTALGSQALSAYASYEQLVGGVNKLYGNMGLSLEEYAQANGTTVDAVRDEWQNLEDAQNKVLENAKQAYKTVGMSANEYMEVATSFSAALINSLGDTSEAADRTDVAMRAIGDNVNTFGSDMESVQNAFMGFAKQNYTMLDNLKLGWKAIAEYKLGKIGECLAYC